MKKTIITLYLLIKHYMITWNELESTAPDIIKELLNWLKLHKENPLYHPEKNAYEHTKIVTERLMTTNDMDLVMSGFFHDISKSIVAEKSDDGDWNSSHGHQDVSCKLILRYKDWIQELGANPYVVHEIVKNHMKIKFGAISRKDRDKLDRYSISPKLNRFVNADNMKQKWELDEGLNLKKHNKFRVGQIVKNDDGDTDYRVGIIQKITDDVMLIKWTFGNRTILSQYHISIDTPISIIDVPDELREGDEILTTKPIRTVRHDHGIVDLPVNTKGEIADIGETYFILSFHIDFDGYGNLEHIVASTHFDEDAVKPYIERLNEGLNLRKVEGDKQFGRVTVHYKILSDDDLSDWDKEAIGKHNIKNPTELTYLVDGEPLPEDSYPDGNQIKQLQMVLDSSNEINDYFHERGFHLWRY